MPKKSSQPPTTLAAGRGASKPASGKKKARKSGSRKGTASALKSLFGDKQQLMYRGVTGLTFLGTSAYAGYRFGNTGKSLKSLFEIDGKENVLSKYVDPRLAVGVPAAILGAWKRDRTYGKVALAVGTGLLFSFAAEYANDAGFKMGNKAAKGGAPVLNASAPVQTPATTPAAAEGIAMIDGSGRFVFSDVGRSGEKREAHLEKRIAKLISDLRNLDAQNADRFLATQLSPQGQRLLAPPRPQYASRGYDYAEAIY